MQEQLAAEPHQPPDCQRQRPSHQAQPPRLDDDRQLRISIPCWRRESTPPAGVSATIGILQCGSPADLVGDVESCRRRCSSPWPSWLYIYLAHHSATRSTVFRAGEGVLDATRRPSSLAGVRAPSCSPHLNETAPDVPLPKCYPILDVVCVEVAYSNALPGRAPDDNGRDRRTHPNQKVRCRRCRPRTARMIAIGLPTPATPPSAAAADSTTAHARVDPTPLTAPPPGS